MLWKDVQLITLEVVYVVLILSVLLNVLLAWALKGEMDSSNERARDIHKTYEVVSGPFD